MRNPARFIISPLVKKAYIKTFGCQMNEQDSRQMYRLLGEAGYQKTVDPFLADLILLNTCSIREKAVHKVYSELGRIRLHKEDRPHLVVGIAGCVAEQEKENLAHRFPFVDLIFGPDHICKLPDMLRTVEPSHHRTLINTGFTRRQDFEFVNVLPHVDETPVKAFVNIQKGCDNICSFCIVPFVRGREVSRPHGEIIAEIQALVARGVKEVTLLGQNVNSYGLKSTGGATFAGLLELIAKKTALKRLRFTTSHPKDVGTDLIEQFEVNPILAPHFHLPIQSGSDRILKLMKRQYTRQEYLRIVQVLRKRVPHASISSDMIVGFPTESDVEFEETLTLMRDVGYDFTFSFVYSPRPFTRAARFPDDVEHRVKEERLQRLQDLDREVISRRNLDEVGHEHVVLVEENDAEQKPYSCAGRTASNKVVHFSGPFETGDFVRVFVTQGNPHSLYGRGLRELLS